MPDDGDRASHAKGVPTCCGCGKYHSSEGAELACLRRVVAKLRAENAEYIRALGPGRGMR